MPKKLLVITALLAGVIFLAGSGASLAGAVPPQIYKKSSWKKPQGKKRKG